MASPYSDFVPDDKLVELTGYKRAAEQNAYLRRMGLVPFRGRNGHPRVTWEAVNRIMAGEKTRGRLPTEPDLGALDGPQTHAR